MKITETKNLYADDLRQLCIDNDWYTRGTNEEYQDLFLMVKLVHEKGCTNEGIFSVASNIYEHSDFDFCDRMGAIQSIMFSIAKLINHYFAVEE